MWIVLQEILPKAEKEATDGLIASSGFLSCLAKSNKGRQRYTRGTEETLPLGHAVIFLCC